MNISEEDMRYVNSCKQKFMDRGRGYWPIFQRKYPHDSQRLQEILGDMLQFLVHSWEVEAEFLFKELKAEAVTAGASDEVVSKYAAWKAEREVADKLEDENHGELSTEN